MKQADQLSEFVRMCYANGDDANTIRQRLADTGWSDPEICEAMSLWEPGRPPVPRPRPYASAREAVLHGILFIALGAIAWHLCQLGMALIDQAIPDPGEYPRSAGSAARWSIASLIAFTPVFLLINRHVGAMGRGNAARRRSLVRRWFATVTLLITALLLLGGAVHVIHAFLNGDLTMRFACKALLVAAVSGLVLAYYRDELHD
ncbi:DUF5671 domain-containing protein [Paracoccus sp. ME4]|uniref:DUF5671 domain-containing protein n=1 Tax=Paracoccus sp. ME4 TaxID=3138066 RepID=UPI00398BB6ED